MAFPGSTTFGNAAGAATRIANTLRGPRNTSPQDYTVGQFGSGSTLAPQTTMPLQAGPSPATPYDVSPVSAAMKIASAWQTAIANRDISANNQRILDAKAAAEAATAQSESDYRQARIDALDPENIGAAALARKTGTLQAQIANPLPPKDPIIKKSPDELTPFVKAGRLSQASADDISANGIPQSRWNSIVTTAPPRPATAKLDMFGGKFDPDAISDAIYNKKFLADPSGYSRGQWGEVQTSMTKRHPDFDMADYQGQAKEYLGNIRTMTGSKLTQMGMNFEGVSGALELARNSAARLYAIAPEFAQTPINGLSQALAQNWNAYGPEVRDAVSDFISKTESAKLQYASMLAAAGAPHERVLQHTDEMVNYKRPLGSFDAQVDAAEADIGIRRDAYQHIAQRHGANEYATPGSKPQFPPLPGAGGVETPAATGIGGATHTFDPVNGLQPVKRP